MSVRFDVRMWRELNTPVKGRELMLLVRLMPEELGELPADESVGGRFMWMSEVGDGMV